MKFQSLLILNEIGNVIGSISLWNDKQRMRLVGTLTVMNEHLHTFDELIRKFESTHNPQGVESRIVNFEPRDNRLLGSGSPGVWEMAFFVGDSFASERLFGKFQEEIELTLPYTLEPVCRK